MLSGLAFTAALVAASAQPDPCALRALVDEPSRALVERVAKAPEGRAKACMTAVLANALAREGKGNDAAGRFAEAIEGLPEIANALEIAKRRATSAPPGPAKHAPPTTHDDAAQLVMRLVREASPKAAVEAALAFEKGAPKLTAPHEAFEVAAVTALVRADRIPEALARTEKLPKEPAFVKARAWALSKGKRYADARDAYASIVTDDPALLAEQAFLTAFAAYELGDLDDAKRRFVAAAAATKGTSWEGPVRWYTAFCDLVRGRWKDAVPTLEALVAELPGEREILKHRYWLARARIESGVAAEKKRGKAELAKLADNEIIEFYGMLARRRLGRKPIRGADVPPDAMAKLARDDEEAKKVLLLWNLGLDDEARTFGRGLGDGAPEIGLLHKVGDATFGWRRGARFIPFPRTKGGRLVKDPRWRVSFASPWRAAVEDSAKRHGISPSFAYAIMRTESGFDPRAVSVAGALGVIQLLPSAARGSARLAGRPVEDAQRIFEPEVAIDLGTALLATGKKEFGSTMLSAAAYNGGAHNLVEWMKEHRALELELFIERIPFKETRDYIKRVTAVDAVYRGLEGGDVALDLPDAIPAPPATYTHFPMDE